MDIIDLTDLPTLLPCKRCGYPYGRFNVYGTTSIRPLPKYSVSCPGCSYRTKIKNTQQEAYAAWNQRDKRKVTI